MVSVVPSVVSATEAARRMEKEVRALASWVRLEVRRDAMAPLHAYSLITYHNTT